MGSAEIIRSPSRVQFDPHDAVCRGMLRPHVEIIGISTFWILFDLKPIHDAPFIRVYLRAGTGTRPYVFYLCPSASICGSSSLR